MHYRGFVFVPEPTEEAVAEAMKEHGGRWLTFPSDAAGDKWDWYRCGGREDGYLQGDAEMDRRETHNGFNFDGSNTSARQNSCKARDVPMDRRQVYFFVAASNWVEREFFVHGYPESRFEDNRLFVEQFEKALADHPDSWVVVVDAHN